MTHDQAAADRERIAEAIRDKYDHAETHVPIPATLDAALDAFKELCEPKGWSFGFDVGWYATKDGERIDMYPSGASEKCAPVRGSHAADVCRLVCEVLDREANPPENQCPECRTLMVRSGRVWKCLNCGTEKEPKHGT